MKKLLNCRRSILAIFAVTILFALAVINKIDTSASIAAIIMSVAASNAYQGKKEDKE